MTDCEHAPERGVTGPVSGSSGSWSQLATRIALTRPDEFAAFTTPEMPTSWVGLRFARRA